MKEKTLTFLMFCVMLCISFLCMGISEGGQLELDLAIDKPVLLADKKQTAYLRVGLTGADLDDGRKRAPVNVAIVIDKSGSMSGEKIEKAKEAAIMAIKCLNSNDIVSVVTYDSVINVLVPATKVSDKHAIFRAIRNIRAGGSTALFGGVSKGAEEVKKFLSKAYVNQLILLSDGLANVGPSSSGELGCLGKSLIKDGISVTTIGLGLGYNEDLMTKLAYESDGSHYFAENAEDLLRIFDEEFDSLLKVVVQEIQVQIICSPGVRPVRLLGRKGEIDGQIASVFINNLYKEHEKFVLLEVEVPEKEKGFNQKIAKVKVTYDNVSNHKTDKFNRSLYVQFSDSEKLIEKRTNEKVMIDVVELIATERNELAMKLRDEGKTEQARSLLVQNKDYLSSSALRYNSERLQKYANVNEKDSKNLDEENWARQRKIMKESQFHNKTQQGSR